MTCISSNTLIHDPLILYLCYIKMSVSNISQIYITLDPNVQGDITYGMTHGTPSIPLKTKANTLYRGTPLNNNDAYKPHIPQWFTHDPGHDYITKPGYKRNDFEIIKTIKLVNLKNSIVRNVLNVAIDRLTPYEYNMINQMYQAKFTAQQSIPTIQQLKHRLKSVYGGITFMEQVEGMDDKSFTERSVRTKKLRTFLKHYKLESGMRYSLDVYDHILCNLITHVFTKYKFFDGVKGWFHEEWQTAWHDKYEDGSMMFKSEVAMVLDDDKYLSLQSESTNVLMNPQGGGIITYKSKRLGCKNKRTLIVS